MNKLFHKLTSILRKQKGPNLSVIPFALGRIYACTYRNWHNDPRPLLLILGSNAFYTVGINIHYLGGYKHSLSRFIMLMRESKKVLNGKIIYQTMKMRIPQVPKISFRKYFTSMLKGKLVSEGISTLPEPELTKFVADPFIKQLNNRIHPPELSYNKTPFNNQNREEIRSQINRVQYSVDRQKPFSDRGAKHVVQYRPRGE